MDSPDDPTALLLAWRAGDAGALERLLPFVYAELRRIAQRCLRMERPEHSLQATALVNEGYIRLMEARRATGVTARTSWLCLRG